MMRQARSKIAAAALLAALFAADARAAPASSDSEIAELVIREVQAVLAPDGVVGAAVAVRVNGRTLFYNFGLADPARNVPVTSDSLFNLASLSKCFDVTLLAMAIERGEVKFDDAVVKYIPELARGGDIDNVTLGGLATHTSGLTLPQDLPPWPQAHYTWRSFTRYLNAWHIPDGFRRGEQYSYSHAGFMLMHVALERRFGIPYRALLEQRLLRPLSLHSTTLPLRARGSVANLKPALLARAVQGYHGDGYPIGQPGNMQGYYFWPGTGQMFSSARDMAAFLTVQMGEGPQDPVLRAAVALTHQARAEIHSETSQAMAWEVQQGEPTIIDKNGGLDNTSNYIGMVRGQPLGILILTNRGKLEVVDAGRRILKDLAEPARTGARE